MRRTGQSRCGGIHRGEIGASAEFYDYDDKYINGTSQLYIPARIPDEAAEKVRETAVRVYRLLDVPVLPGLTFSSQRKITGSF